MKIIYENCVVKNNMKEDHRSYIRNFCSFEKKFFRLSFRNCKGVASIAAMIFFHIIKIKEVGQVMNSVSVLFTHPFSLRLIT